MYNNKHRVDPPSILDKK